MSRLPLVVILGATGTGKTKLSLELAKRFKGEIISADSMQLYKELDIVTAKATRDEQKLAKHHMIDILGPEETYTVIDYRNKALKIIENLFSKNTLPIVVGGTNYYIEALLWNLLIEEPGDNRVWLDRNDFELSSEELHRKLKLLDPDMARRLHPKNKRKILRSLEVLRQKGRPHSELLKEQHERKGASQTSGALRFNNALIFRLDCDKDVLHERLNTRVDHMVPEGLIQELRNFHEKYIGAIPCPDYTKGVFQSIGFKEFHSYLTLPVDEQSSDGGKTLLAECIERLKLVTRRYARKQNKWIKNRFLARTDREVPPMYGLDTTDPTQWSEKVTKPCIEIIESFTLGTPSNHRPLAKIEDIVSRANTEDLSYVCDICERVFVGDFQWEAHLKSNRHKKMLERRKALKKAETNAVESSIGPCT